MVSNECPEYQSPLIQQYLPMARTVAANLKRRFLWVDMEDLYSYSLYGLAVAARLYSEKHGVSFSAFAYRKVAYLAIDAMRKDRLIRRKDSVSRRVVQWSSQDAQAELMPDARSQEPQRRLEARDTLAHIMRRLDPRDRRLLLLHYGDGLNFREISKVFRLSESAISLRHQSLLSRIRRMSAAGQC